MQIFNGSFNGHVLALSQAYMLPLLVSKHAFLRKALLHVESSFL